MTNAIAKALVKPPGPWQVDSGGGIFLKTPFGRYDIRRRSITGNDAFRLWGLVYGQAATEAELREIAEADHRARISAALNPDLIAELAEALKLAGDYLEACKVNGLPDLGAASRMPFLDDVISGVDAALAPFKEKAND
jgi:hypothetical protein